MKIHSSFISLLFFLSMFSSSYIYAQNQVTVGFDGLPDLALDVGDFGVQFTGAQVLACGSSLNCPEFPPYSGLNVIYDNPTSSPPGQIIAIFSSEETGIVKEVSARVTGNRNVSMIAYNHHGQVLGSDQTGGPNYTSAGTGIPPNKLLEISIDDGSIARVVFRDGGNTFTIDNFAFSYHLSTVVIDPGHGLITRSDGTSAYQREPSVTYALIEDQLTLSMAREVRNLLEQKGIRVLMTRDSEDAPFAPVDCGVPCLADIRERVRWIDDQEDADLMVSIHTNGGPPTANGTEQFIRPGASGSEISLATEIHTQLVSSGLRDRRVQNRVVSSIQRVSIPNALSEVAFHSNSDLAPGQVITDEERLHTSSDDLAALIAEGIINYLNEQDQ